MDRWRGRERKKWSEIGGERWREGVRAMHEWGDGLMEKDGEGDA